MHDLPQSRASERLGRTFAASDFAEADDAAASGLASGEASSASATPAYDPEIAGTVETAVAEVTGSQTRPW